MRRFVLQQNVVRFQHALEIERNETLRRSIQEMLVACRRELALLEAELLGAQVAPVRSSANSAWREHQHAGSFRSDFDSSPHPCMVLDPHPGLTILDINDAHYEATHSSRDAIGRPLFEIFPDDPANSGAEGVCSLYASLRAAADSGRRQTMPAHRYDVRAADGRFRERYWRSETMPLVDEEGRLLFLLHKGEDVTAEVMARQAN